MLRNRKFKSAIELAEHAHSIAPNEASGITNILDLIMGISYFMFGDLNKSAFYLEKASRINLESGNYIIAFTATAYLAAILGVRLKSREAHRVCIGAIELAERQGVGLLPATGTIHVELGIVHFHRANYQSALMELQEGIQRHRFITANPDLTLGYCFLAHTKVQLGDEKGANQAIHQAYILSQDYGILDLSKLFEAHQALLDLQTGNLAAAQRWIDQQPTCDDLVWIVRFEVEIVRIIVMISRKKYQAALAAIENVYSSALKNEMLCYVVAYHILEAVALAGIGRGKEASMALQKAALMAMPEECTVFFLIGSSFLRPLLRGVENREALAFLAPLIADVAEGSSALTVAKVEHPSKPIEPLSDRELEVLALIAQGSSNHEIAKRLRVSLSTVKTFVRRIYSKLDVKNRTKAVHVARNMGLLTDS